MRINVTFPDNDPMYEVICNFIDLEVTALPPVDTTINVVGNWYRVTHIHLDVRGDKSTAWFVKVLPIENPDPTHIMDSRWTA